MTDTGTIEELLEDIRNALQNIRDEMIKYNRYIGNTMMTPYEERMSNVEYIKGQRSPML